MKRRALLLLLTAACGTTPAAGSEGSSGEPPLSGSTATTNSTTSTTDSLPAGSSSTTQVDKTVGDSFLIPADVMGIDTECSTFSQDCPLGEKCNVWANYGGSAWNATKCVPLAPDPAEVDEPCTVEGVGVSGLDSCALGSMCWDVDSRTQQGTCVPFCSGSDWAPLRSDPNRECSITGAGILTLCFLNCDPLEPLPCAQGEACYPIENGFVCAQDDSGADGTLWDACEFINDCDPGLLCVNPELSAMCPEGAGGCCLPVCSISASDCPVAMLCEPWFVSGQIQPGYEDVGICRDAGPED